MIKRVLWLFACLVCNQAGAQDPATGLKTAVNVDLVGDFAASQESAGLDRLYVRSAEVVFYAPIDHMLEGALSLAAHPEGGEMVAEVHEAYVSTDKLIPMSQLRVGQFFLGIGRLNQYHQHEWPFISTPIVHERFFGPEGVSDAGAEYRILLPLPFYLDLTLGVTNGFNFGHAHTEGEKPRKNTHYARLVTFASFDAFDMQTGVSALRRHDSAGEEVTLVGWDLTAKRKNREIMKYLWQSEVWYREQKPMDAPKEKNLGAYVHPQYGFDSRLELGMRFDYFTNLSLKDAAGANVRNSESGVSPTLGYRISEFSVARLAYEYRQTVLDDAKTENHLIQTQVAFSLGAHPSHSF
jgi:hypothetical protein